MSLLEWVRIVGEFDDAKITGNICFKGSYAGVAHVRGSRAWIEVFIPCFMLEECIVNGKHVSLLHASLNCSPELAVVHLLVVF